MLCEIILKWLLRTALVWTTKSNKVAHFKVVSQLTPPHWFCFAPLIFMVTVDVFLFKFLICGIV